jgi:hypothetical protein
MDRRGVQFHPERAGQIGQLADPWHEKVVGPLRDVRTRWKADAKEDEELTALRDRLKTLELDAERELLVRLQRLTKDWPERDAQPTGVWLEALAGGAAQASPDALQILLRAVRGRISGWSAWCRGHCRSSRRCGRWSGRCRDSRLGGRFCSSLRSDWLGARRLG